MEPPHLPTPSGWQGRVLYEEGFQQGYQIAELVGQGFLGNVYKAMGVEDGKEYSIKMLRTVEEQEDEDWYVNEVEVLRAVSSLDCPFLLKLYDAASSPHCGRVLITQFARDTLQERL